MNQEKIPHRETPIDVTEHEGEAKTNVWMRRLLFLMLIGICVSFAAPTFGSCTGAIGSGGSKVWGTFKVGERTVTVRESDFHRAASRLAAVYRLLGRERSKDDEVWSEIIVDEVAKESGIHASDEQVRKFLESVPAFQADGRFDEAKYSAEIKDLHKYMGVDHSELSAALKTVLRVQTYKMVWLSAYQVPRSREAYEEWKKTNVKLSADYLVQPFEPLVEKARQMPITDQDIQLAATLNPVREMRAIPGRRGFEAAYVRTKDVTPAQRAAMDAFAKEAHLLDAVDKDETTESAAWSQFFANFKEGQAYTKETWGALKRPEFERLLAEWQKGPEPRDEKTKPKDPADLAWPATPREQFYTYWRPFVEAEVLSKEILRHLSRRAERESKSFAELLPEYERFGVKVVTTPEPLTDADLIEKFPEGLARDSEIESQVRSQFRPPAPGSQFRPTVLREPVQATRVQSRIADRGWIAVRWTAYEPARERELAEIRDKIAEFYRGYRAHDLAAAVLDGIRQKVDAAGPGVDAKRQTLRESAAAAGLEVQHLRRFNKFTERVVPPVLAAGATQAEKDAAARIAARGIVLDRYDYLGRLEPGKFEMPVYRDDASGAAYLVMLVEKHEPEPVEMDDVTLKIDRARRDRQSYMELNDKLSLKELKKRYQLELTKEGSTATGKKDADAPE